MSDAQRSAVLDRIEQVLADLLELIRPPKPTLRLVDGDSEKGE
jgi:hypothetical protein